MWAFGLKLLVVTMVSYLPWFDLMFPEGEALCKSGPSFCRAILTPARFLMDITLNVPVLAFSFMCTPGMVAGDGVMMEVLPFSILPYLISAVVPVIWSGETGRVNHEVSDRFLSFCTSFSRDVNHNRCSYTFTSHTSDSVAVCISS